MRLPPPSSRLAEADLAWRAQSAAVLNVGTTMNTRDGFLEYVLDQLSGVENLLSRPMFGGVGLYAGTVFFGIIYRDILYLKVDDRTRRDYERAGMKPFTPYAPRTTTMQYYEVPAGVLENGEDLTAWAQKAIAAAERSALQKKSR
jgi:DNA transformation protein and related proteins